MKKKVLKIALLTLTIVMVASMMMACGGGDNASIEKAVKAHFSDAQSVSVSDIVITDTGVVGKVAAANAEVKDADGNVEKYVISATNVDLTTGKTGDWTVLYATPAS